MRMINALNIHLTICKSLFRSLLLLLPVASAHGMEMIQMAFELWARAPNGMTSFSNASFQFLPPRKLHAHSSPAYSIENPRHLNSNQTKEKLRKRRCTSREAGIYYHIHKGFDKVRCHGMGNLLNLWMVDTKKDSRKLTCQRQHGDYGVQEGNEPLYANPDVVMR